uniref:Uncharacterized protein LOC117351126 isoform X5 n=1 Tax=Geotrypetes seraphini TaxID=260995 RepID=A0A6P8Q3W4_GEOSA|nr:uncharacterized protein LOC117351126 isoform X5 [Geotrypetes seraphini]
MRWTGISNTHPSLNTSAKENIKATKNHALMQTLAKHACWHLDNGPFFEEERRKETPDLPEFADGSTKNGILHSSIMPGRQVGGRQIKRYNRFLRNLEGRRLPSTGEAGAGSWEGPGSQEDQAAGRTRRT